MNKDEKIFDAAVDCQERNDKAKFCGAVFDSKTLPECQTEYAQPCLTEPPVIIKVPVVLAENTIQIDIESKVKLDHPAIEIKRIKKNLFLTQCKLLPRVGYPCYKKGKLFIKGYVRKNIEYATACCVGCDAISGDIKHTTVYTPFECLAQIIFDKPPVVKANPVPTELEYFDPKILGSDLHESDFENEEFFNEKIFCELVSAKFNEADIAIDEKPIGKNFPVEASFQTFVEKMTVDLKLKILQLQQIKICK